MRLIDADALEAILNNWEEKEADRTENDGSDGTTRIVHPVETDTDEMINLISMQPTIIPTIPHSQWIPVTERLPECGEHYESNDVLVSVDYRPDDPEETKDTFVSIDHVCFNCFEQGEFSIERDNPYDTEPSPYFVTHWMPLPEPYQYAEVETNEAD